MSSSQEPLYPNQVVPLTLTSLVFIGSTIILFGEIFVMNHFLHSQGNIVPVLRWPDVLVGVTIYLKTSIDFAIFIGRLMSKYPGWKNRIMIEIGTALGNTLGTLAILLLWDVFREVKFLMAIMITIAALVLLRLAEEGLEHAKDEAGKYKISFGGLELYFERGLHRFNMLIAPVLNRIVPRTDMKESGRKTLMGLFVLAFSIPFILGLDDFAGYIPLFNIVNVFGFGTGVFLGHMALNIALFMSPHHTIKVVKHPLISFFGSIAFVGLALWGLVEVAKLIGM